MTIGSVPTNGSGSGEAFLFNTASTSGSATLAATPSAGDTLVLQAAAGTNTQGFASLSQTGVKWFPIGSSRTTLSAEGWLGVVGAGASATINFTTLVAGNTSNIRFNVAVESGTPTTRAIYGVSNGTSTTAISSASITPPAGFDAVLYTAVRAGGGGVSAPSQGTALTSGSTGFAFSRLKIASTTGSYQTTYTQTSGSYETFSFILFAPTSAQASALSANQTLIAATGTDSAWPAVYDRRLNTTVISSAVSAWEDARFGSSSGTTGPQLSQATAGNRPALSGTWGGGSELITLTAASTQYLTSAASATYALSPTTAIYVVAIYEATGTGPIAGVAKDETSSTTYPYAMLQGGGSNHKADFAPEGVTTGRVQPDSGVAFADSTSRIAAIGHSIPVSGNTASDVVWRYWFGGHQIRRHHGVTTATSGNNKIVVGRLGSTYGSGKLHWLGVTTQDLTAAQWQSLIAFANTQFGAAAETSKRNTIVFAGDSLEYGSQSTDPMTAAIGTGTKSPSYVCANTTSGSRGSLVTQGQDVGDVHAYNYGVSGRTLQVIVDEFARELAPNIDGQRTGHQVLWVRGIGNFVQNTNATIAQLRTVATSLYSTATAAGFDRVVWETEIDRGSGSNGTNANGTGWYTDNSWGTVSANGTVVQTFNTDLRTSLSTYGTHLNDVEALSQYQINRVSTRAMLDTTYYASDKVHLNDTGYSLLGTTRKTFLDTNDTILWPLPASSVSSAGTASALLTLAAIRAAAAQSGGLGSALVTLSAIVAASNAQFILVGDFALNDTTPALSLLNTTPDVTAPNATPTLTLADTTPALTEVEA